MSKYDDLDKAYERYVGATAVKEALTKLRDEHKDTFDEHANLVVGAALMNAIEEFGEAGADYHRLRKQMEEDERHEGDEPWQDPETDLYRAEQAEQRGM